MKTIYFFLLLSMACLVSAAQNVKRIENQKDAWGLKYVFTGEVKSGLPNGMGVASYTSGNVIRYAGNFINGTYNGKGTMFFDNGAFITGNWKNGKLEGKGTNLTDNDVLYIGDFSNGLKNGQGNLFFKDNSITKGSFKDDKQNGRCLTIWQDGSIISDQMYVNDQKNGTGYQYEVKLKKLYEGEWKDDKWIQSTTPPFKNFLKAPEFTAEITNDHILMGSVNSDKFLKDTAFYYDLEKKKRYFGYYINGKLKNGIIIRDDSTRFMGQIDNIGAQGYCYDFKFKKFYSEGNYSDDYLSGPILDIDLTKKTVYYGNAVKGQFTGKAYFFNEKGTMYAGDYLNGKFTGNGYRLEGNGKYTSGTWENGQVKKLTTIITPAGETISGNPKSFVEGLNTVIKTFNGFYADIEGGIVDLDTDEYNDAGDDYFDLNVSLVSVPGTIGNNLIISDFDKNTFYRARFLKTNSAEKAKDKYKELAAALLKNPLANPTVPGKIKLTGKTITPDLSNDKTITVYDLPKNISGYSDFHIWLVIEKNDDGDYIVYLDMGEKEEK